jgi:hypothetical protein
VTLGTFPFGRPLLPARPTANGPQSCFLLGAYPSALHIAWRPPLAGVKPANALAIDNEPEPFWTGEDEHERIEQWKATVGWNLEQHGKARPAGPRNNGSTGRAVVEHHLLPLGARRSDAWMTDCLDTYHLSVGMARRVARSYARLAEDRGWPLVDLPAHPRDAEIIRRAQFQRLRGELESCRPEIVITLGRAALEVMRQLLDNSVPVQLLPDRDYGVPSTHRLKGRVVRWYRLAHPGLLSRPGSKVDEWRDAHQHWMASAGI